MGRLTLIRNATQSLQEISQMQTTLAQHLNTQQEVVESIYDDVQMSVNNMNMANAQLQKTHKLFGEARLWVFLFLILASLVLLFLDYYG